MVLNYFLYSRPLCRKTIAVSQNLYSRPLCSTNKLFHFTDLFAKLQHTPGSTTDILHSATFNFSRLIEEIEFGDLPNVRSLIGFLKSGVLTNQSNNEQTHPLIQFLIKFQSKLVYNFQLNDLNPGPAAVLH